MFCRRGVTPPHRPSPGRMCYTRLMNGRAFVPARDTRFYLLSAHRQPLPENIAAHYIAAFTQPNDLVVDPFVASDAVVRSALAQGRRILAVDSNPIVAWATRVQATLPNARDINAALLRLGDTRKEGETLRTTLEKLYASRCAECGGDVTVDYFVWKRERTNNLLARKQYTCAQCGARHDDATPGDRQRALAAAPRGLSYHLLVQRLLVDDPVNTATLKRLLELYTPRNLNALAAVTQKLDVDFRDDAARNVIAALVLHALDVGTSLYPSPGALPMREIPAEFVERNIWRALEDAARGLSEHAPALRLSTGAAQVASSTTPSAYIGQGGARFLAENVVKTNAALILASPARLDPTFWELSFLWVRWLLGKNAAAPLQVFLDPENQRWAWYGKALTNAIADAAKLVRPGGRFTLAFPAGSHAMIEALMLAASPVFALDTMSFRPDRGATDSTEWGALRGEYRVTWTRADHSPAPQAAQNVAPKIRAGALDAARSILDARSEPLAYSWLHHAGLDKLARDGILAETLNAKYRDGDNAFQFLRHRMEEGFKEGYIREIDHFRDKTRVLWEKPTSPSGALPISLRVQAVVHDILFQAQRIGVNALEDAVLAKFPGLLTPEVELVELCASAYAELRDKEWFWRDENADEWLARARALMRRLGEHLQMDVVENNPRFEMVWRIEKIIPGSARGAIQQEKIVEDAYAILFRRNVDFLELTGLPTAPLRGLVILPETQVALTRERLRRDVRWLKKLERAGWDFLRLPLVEMLLREDYATRPEFQLALGLDPALIEGQEQLQLL